ncbi:MAG: SpoIID/LytB domain-containing protein [Thermotogae bacterium]|nr:SpoIID/LytB domain-containing protein [Thermotogota bacterium]
MKRFSVLFSVLLISISVLLGMEIKIGLSQNGGPFKNVKRLLIESNNLSINDEVKLHSSIEIKFSKGKLLVLQNKRTIYKGIYLKVSTDSGIMQLKRLDNNLTIRVPGYLILFPANYIQIINVLDLETYVSLVIPYEIGNAPFEAIKAQAVISRTYTLRNLGRHSDEGFDLCSTVHCQVYKGIPSVDLSKYINATRETFGETLLYKGKLIDPVYSSNNGGVIASASEVWNGDYPYILPLDDMDKNGIPYGAFSDTYSWIVEIPRMELYEKLINNPNYFPGAFISGIEILERGPSGRVTRIRIKGEKDIEMSGNTFRFLAGLRSTLFDVEYVPFTDKFIFKGRGWGHGVGLSQWGAIDMASRGKKYTDILQHYYRGSYLNSGLRVIVNNYDSIKNLKLVFYVDGKKYDVQGKETVVPNIHVGLHEIKLSSSNVLFKDIVKKVFVSDEKGAIVYFKPTISEKAPIILKNPEVVLTSKNSLYLKLIFLDSNRVEVPYTGRIKFIDENGNAVMTKVENSLQPFMITLKLKEGENLFKVVPLDHKINPVWLKIIKNTELPVEPQVSVDNISKGVGLKIKNINNDISKILVYRKSELSEEWLKLAELGSKGNYFFDIAVDDVGDYIYGISFVNKFGSESKKTIVSVSRDFGPIKLIVEKPKAHPKKMPNLPEKYIDIKSLFADKLNYVDLQSSENIELSNQGTVLGKSLRVIPSNDKLKIVDKDDLKTISSESKVILKSERNISIKVKGVLTNQVEILSENDGQTIKVVLYEKLRDYVARQLTKFCFEDDPSELKKLKAVLIRTNVVYSLLTGRYKTEDYDLPYNLCNFSIGGNLSLKEAYKLVDETENLVITVANKIVDGIFVINNNGCMAKDPDKWYLIASPNIKSKEVLWTKEYSSKELGELIKKSFIDLGNISRVSIVSKDKYGRISHLRFIGKKGILNIFGEDSIRYILKLDGSVFNVVEENGRFAFKGKAFGNCEGVSLEDAENLAKKGLKYQQILEKYYLNPKITSFLGLSALLPSIENGKYDFSKFRESDFKELSKNSKIEFFKDKEGMKLVYSFLKNGDGIAGLKVEMLFFEPFKSLNFEIDGDSSGNFIRLKFIDSQGEIFLTPSVRIDWGGAGSLSINLNKLIYQTWNNIKINKIPDFPLILKEVYLVASKSSTSNSGEIILKKLEVSR